MLSLSCDFSPQQLAGVQHLIVVLQTEATADPRWPFSNHLCFFFPHQYWRHEETPIHPQRACSPFLCHWNNGARSLPSLADSYSISKPPWSSHRSSSNRYKIECIDRHHLPWALPSFGDWISSLIRWASHSYKLSFSPIHSQRTLLYTQYRSGPGTQGKAPEGYTQPVGPVTLYF